MAEIHVEQRRKSHAWLWVLLLLLVVAAVAYYVFYLGDVSVNVGDRGASPVHVALELAARAVEGRMAA